MSFLLHILCFIEDHPPARSEQAPVGVRAHQLQLSSAHTSTYRFPPQSSDSVLQAAPVYTMYLPQQQ